MLPERVLGRFLTSCFAVVFLREKRVLRRVLRRDS